LIEESIKKLEKYYQRGDLFRAYITKEQIIPIEVKLPRISQKEIQSRYDKVLYAIRQLYDAKLPLVAKEVYFKSIGKQTIPIAISFESLEHYLEYFGKTEEYALFVETYERIVARYPVLSTLLYKKPFWVIEYAESWERLLRIVAFLEVNHRPACYIRELSIEGVDTKFIEKHTKLLDMLLSHLRNHTPLTTLSNFAFEKRYGFRYPLPQIRFRILDPKLAISGIRDMALTTEAFAKIAIGCKRVFIIENQITFLSMFDISDAIVIFGSGYKLSILQEIAWLKSKEIFYWSDIDEDGFAMLSQIRAYLPQTRSLLMDVETVEQYKDFSVRHTNTKRYGTLAHLNEEECRLYNRLQEGYYGVGFRLEQERIGFDYVKERVLSDEQ